MRLAEPAFHRPAGQGLQTLFQALHAEQEQRQAGTQLQPARVVVEGQSQGQGQYADARPFQSLFHIFLPLRAGIEAGLARACLVPAPRRGTTGNGVPTLGGQGHRPVAHSFVHNIWCCGCSESPLSWGRRFSPAQAVRK